MKSLQASRLCFNKEWASHFSLQKSAKRQSGSHERGQKSVLDFLSKLSHHSNNILTFHGVLFLVKASKHSQA